MTYDDVWSKIEIFFDDNSEKGSARLAALIFFDMAKLVSNQFDEDQRESIEAAKKYWKGDASDEDRLRHLEKILKNQDHISRSYAPFSRVLCINRIASGPLHTTGGLSYSAVEYILQIAESCEIPPEKIDEIFCLRIHGY